jgi:hypothetical protein
LIQYRTLAWFMVMAPPSSIDNLSLHPILLWLRIALALQVFEE